MIDFAQLETAKIESGAKEEIRRLDAELHTARQAAQTAEQIAFKDASTAVHELDQMAASHRFVGMMCVPPRLPIPVDQAVPTFNVDGT